MDEVEVDVVDAQPLQALRRFRRRVLTAGIELGRDEDVTTRYAAVLQRPADALLVAVGLRGVNVPVAEFEGPSNGVDALASVAHLPDTETEHGNRATIRQCSNVVRVSVVATHVKI